jgi:flagellar biosynthesis/type III secretory pathway M-ring protein FliF/YscJ
VWQTTQPTTENSKNKIWHKENTKQKELITKTALQRKHFHTITTITITVVVAATTAAAAAATTTTIITNFQNILLQLTASIIQSA